MGRMPKLPVKKMVEDMGDEAIFILGAFYKGRLRASKPYPNIEGKDEEQLYQACVNYCWRMLCFTHCDWRPHNCIPYCATFDIDSYFYERNQRGEITRGEERERRKQTIKFLDDLLGIAESKTDIFEQKGACQWLLTGGI